MSIGGNRSPYRPPCSSDADSPEFYWLGEPWQHYLASEAAVTRLQNTTTVPNYLDPSCMGYVSADIPPYMKQNQAYYSCQDGGGGGECDVFCGPWAEPVPANTYAPYSPGEVISVAQCRKLGYKYVVARKAWHGLFGFTSTDGICCNNGSKPAASGSPDNTKYLTLTYSCVMTTKRQASAMAEINTSIYTISGTVSINRYSGVFTATGIVATDEEIVTLYDGTPVSDDTTDLDIGTIGVIANAVAWMVPNCLQPGVTGHVDDPTDDPIQGDDAPIGSGGTIAATITNTTYTRDWTGDVFFGNGVDESDGYAYFNYSISSTLSDAYTSDDVNADCDTLLGYWNLADDVQIPWRTDGNCTSGPLMTYLEEGANAPFVANGADMDNSYTATTLAAYSVTSMLLGAPTTSGCDPYFDFRAQVYGPVPSEDCDPCYGIEGWGASAPSWAPNATQWTNALDASSLLPGAFAAYNTLYTGLTCCNDPVTYYGGCLHKSKYAEVTLLGAPSHNFARPCGPKDAETIDQTSISCSTDPPSGTLRWPDCSNPCPTPPTGGGEWNDNYPKGDFCLVSWSFNYRDNFTDSGDANYRPVTGAWKGISCSQECSDFLPCCPASVFITNNDEVAANSQFFTIPNLALDDCYGAQWQMMPMQWMTDPLWQVPQPPCDITEGAAWTEDDGTGHADTDSVWYYPQRPYEECRCSLPEGAPALPGGCFLGVLDVADINSAGDYTTAATEGNVVQPPTPASCWMPWWTWAVNRYNTVIGDGRFACDYADPLAVCDDNIELEPP